MNKIKKITESKQVALGLRIYVGLFPLLLFVVLEILNPASSAGLFVNLWGGIPSILFSVFLIFCAALAVYALCGRVWAAYGLVSLVLLIMYIVNFYRMSIAGGVLVPTDFFLAGAALQMIEPQAINITRRLVAVVVMVIALNVPLCFVKLRFDWRRLAVLPVVALIVVMLSGNFAFRQIFPIFGLQRDTVSVRYRDHGLILGFYSELIIHNTQGGLNAQHAELLERISGTRARNVTEAEASTPNVIVIMSEAFFDPTVLPNITFSQYPVPNFRRLGAQSGLSGGLIVPVFGGGTANTELEFLAATSHLFFGNRFYVPFESPSRYFGRDITTTMPWLFRENGYRTVAVHPFYGDFFNRRDIYPRLGFDEFIAKEQMPDAPVKGEFISDEYFTDRIIEEILLAEELDMPLFLFGISMQNHWGFDPLKYGTLELDVMSYSPYLDEYRTSIMNSFLQGIFDADKQLGRLAYFVENRDTPTIIVFFGDHLPILGTQADRVFEHLRFIGHQEDFLWDLEDMLAIFSSHYLVWANFELNQQDWGTISTYLLGAWVTELSGINLNRYFTYLLNGHENLRILHNSLYQYGDGEIFGTWRYRGEPHVQALEALWHEKFLGTGDFRRSLSDIIP